MTFVDKLRALIVDKVSEKTINKLRDRAIDVDYRPGIDYQSLLEIVEQYDILIFRGRLKIDKEVIDRGKRLKILARYGIGLDNIDIDYAVSKGIAIVNAPQASCISVAELTIGLMIAAARNLYLYIDGAKKGEWPKGRYGGFELHGKTIGIIGFGKIGSRVGMYAKAMGMKLLVHDVRDVSLEMSVIGGKQVDLETLLKESHIISLHVPLTPQTYHMINDHTLSLVRDGAIIVNTSRGEVIDSVALLKHIDRLGGVALDVLEEEPPRSPHLLELIKHPKVIVTPHIGAETVEALERISDELIENIMEAIRWR
ncbi:MAG: NAD(P)-dependent oxidoreductase [Ignisphaera sp.]